jgi:hypothetical protein
MAEEIQTEPTLVTRRSELADVVAYLSKHLNADLAKEIIRDFMAGGQPIGSREEIVTGDNGYDSPLAHAALRLYNPQSGLGREGGWGKRIEDTTSE